MSLDADVRFSLDHRPSAPTSFVIRRVVTECRRH